MFSRRRSGDGSFSRSPAGSRGGTGPPGATSLGSDRTGKRGDTPRERKRAQVQTCHAGKWRHAKTTPGTKPLLVVQDAFLVDTFTGNEGGDLVQVLPGYQTGL